MHSRKKVNLTCLGLCPRDYFPPSSSGFDCLGICRALSRKKVNLACFSLFPGDYFPSCAWPELGGLDLRLSMSKALDVPSVFQ